MRDNELISHLNNANRKIALLYKQSKFTETRVQALESVLLQKRSLFQYWISPKKFFRKVNQVHLELMNKHDEELRREADLKEMKSKIIVPIPGIVNGK